jgi:hypothetical protein
MRSRSDCRCRSNSVMRPHLAAGEVARRGRVHRPRRQPSRSTSATRRPAGPKQQFAHGTEVQFIIDDEHAERCSPAREHTRRARRLRLVSRGRVPRHARERCGDRCVLHQPVTAGTFRPGRARAAPRLSPQSGHVSTCAARTSSGRGCSFDTMCEQAVLRPSAGTSLPCPIELGTVARESGARTDT